MLHKRGSVGHMNHERTNSKWLLCEYCTPSILMYIATLYHSCVCVCVCVCVLTKDGNEYKTTVKPLLKSWLQDVSDKEKMYLIVHVSTATRNELMQSIKLTRSTVDKIRADCPIHKDRYVH
jgi:hypothetical protein